MGLFAGSPLRSADCRRLWIAGLPTVVGANLTIFAVPVQIYALTRNSAYVGLSGVFAHYLAGNRVVLLSFVVDLIAMILGRRPRRFILWVVVEGHSGSPRTFAQVDLAGGLPAAGQSSLRSEFFHPIGAANVDGASRVHGDCCRPAAERELDLGGRPGWDLPH